MIMAGQSKTGDLSLHYQCFVGRVMIHVGATYQLNLMNYSKVLTRTMASISVIKGSIAHSNTYTVPAQPYILIVGQS